MAGFVVGLTNTRIEIDPDDILPFIVDFTDWLAGDTLTAHSIVQSVGVTVDSSNISAVPLVVDEYGTIAADKCVVLWLSGATVGAAGKLVLRVNAGTARRDVTYAITVKNR